jgi:hypothetical protein
MKSRVLNHAFGGGVVAFSVSVDQRKTIMKLIASVKSKLLIASLLGISCGAMAATNPFIGNWALTIPGGGAGWLGVVESGDALKGSILWGGGSVLPATKVSVEGDALVVIREYTQKKKDAAGQTVTTKEVETIRATREGETLKLTTQREREGKISGKASFTGKWIPPVGPAPDLSKVKFGPDQVLFDGKSLTGWRLTSANQVNGWSVENGSLINRPVQEEGKPHKSYGNLRTEKEFEDFKLAVEFRVPKGGNSGIYLRGIYEIQVADTFGKGLDSHNMGGLYSRITPSEAAEKPAGEWQTYEITLVDRHLTVVLNGKTVINNQAVLGCTGGALWSDEFRPGPLYLQGDHTGVDYRVIKIFPVVK